LLYPCYETPEELERRRKIRLSRRLPPVYGREALKLTADEKAELEAEGRRAHWRFLLPNHQGDPFATQRTEIHWDDIVRGPQTVDLASMSDPVLIREDGTYLYTLPSVVDDIDLGVTHVIRGDDHVTNTGAQIALFKALGATAPSFGHHNLLTTTTGEGLSKRSGALSIKALREDGYEPMAIVSLAVLIGTSEAVSATPSLKALAGPSIRHRVRNRRRNSIRRNSTCSTGRSSTVWTTMRRRTGWRRPVVDPGDSRAEPFWLAVRSNVDRVAEAGAWWKIVGDGPDNAAALEGEDIEFARAAFDLLPAGEIGPETWSTWTGAVKQATGRKGRALFMPLRIALTGRSSGPEIADLLPLLGREGIAARRP
jgi:glutamyl-tRNA synthetase